MSGKAFPPVVIRASAGTGKTFQLSNRFLGLAAAGMPLDTILATTFTRKAAGEILDRVLLRLAAAGLDDTKRVELARHLGVRLPDRPRCLELLGAMLRNLHRLRVATLDSFFLQVAQSLSLELGLPPGWQIVEEIDDEAFRQEAIRAVLEEQPTRDVLALMHLLTKGEAARSVRRQIADLVGSLYSLYLESPEEAWQSLPRLGKLSDDRLAAALDALEAVAVADKRMASARDENVADARQGDWETFIRKGLTAKILDGSLTFYRKPIPPEVVAGYEPLVGYARAELLGQIAAQTEATRRLLAHFDAAYRRVKMARRGLRFDDVARALAGAQIDGRLEQIAFRLDAGVDHVLLDEFQDTSPLQWRVLRPFAQRAAADRHGSFFCVGDVKQAIYGWRGGAAEIFDALEAQLPGLCPQALDESRRSCQVVIDTVQRVFAQIGSNSVLAAKHADAASRWQGRFQPHTTALSELAGHVRLMTGPKAAEGEDRDAVRLAFAAEEIQRLALQTPEASIGVLVRRNTAVARLIFELRHRGVEASEEGGNPLTDSPAVQVVLSLLSMADHPGNTAARYHVATSPLGPVVGLMRYDDPQAACRLSREVRQSLLVHGYAATLYGWVRQLAPACNPRDLARLRQLVELAYQFQPTAIEPRLRTDQFVALVESRRIESPTPARVRVMTVHQAKGLQFDVVVLPELDVRLAGQAPEIVAGRSGPGEPVNLVCRYPRQEIQSLLPPEISALCARQAARVVEESLCVLYVALTRAVHSVAMIIDPSAGNERNLPTTLAGVLRAALSSGSQTQPLTTLYEHGDPNWFLLQKEKMVGLAALAPPNAPGDGSRVGRVERAPPESESGARPDGDTSLTGTDAQRWSAKGVVCSPTTPFVPQGVPPDATQTPASDRLVVRVAPGRRRRRGLEHRSPSQLEGGPKIALADCLRLDRAGALGRGSLVHAWLERIAWLDEAQPDAAALEAIARAPEFRGLDAKTLLSQFCATLAVPAVAAALSRATYERPAGADAAAIHVRPGITDPQWQVWREWPFAIREDDGLLCGKFDRLVVLCDGPRPVAADVLDFKTDAIGPDDAAAVASRIEYYRPQLEAYRRAAARLLGLPATAVSLRLLFTGPGIVRAV